MGLLSEIEVRSIRGFQDMKFLFRVWDNVPYSANN